MPKNYQSQNKGEINTLTTNGIQVAIKHFLTKKVPVSELLPDFQRRMNTNTIQIIP